MAWWTTQAPYLADDADRADLGRYRWYPITIGKVTYMKRQGPTPDGTHATMLYMHREIMQAQPGQLIHHVNGNGLDNRRANLRVVTQAEHRRAHPIAS